MDTCDVDWRHDSQGSFLNDSLKTSSFLCRSYITLYFNPESFSLKTDVALERPLGNRGSQWKDLLLDVALVEELKKYTVL